MTTLLCMYVFHFYIPFELYIIMSLELSYYLPAEDNSFRFVQNISTIIVFNGEIWFLKCD